jgi:hypothetical protein
LFDAYPDAADAPPAIMVLWVMRTDEATVEARLEGRRGLELKKVAWERTNTRETLGDPGSVL